jgi:hypothetical protein
MGEEQKTDNKTKEEVEKVKKAEAEIAEPKKENVKTEEGAEKNSSDSAQSPVQVVVKEKSHGGMIALIVVLALLLGIVGTLLVLQFTGVVQLQNLFSGDFSSIFTGGKTNGKNSYGGIGAGKFGGVVNNSAAPTVERAKEFCEAQGNAWSQLENVEDLASDEEYISHVTGAYWCSPTDVDSDNYDDDTFVFEIVFTDASFNEIDYYARMIKSDVETLPSNGRVLENSEEFVKMYVPASSGGYHFIASYKNAAIELLAMTMDKANEVLAKIGFPDRSYSDPAEYTESGSGSASKSEAPQDIAAKNDIKKVAAALKEFYANYGRYPEYDYGEDCTDIYGDEVECGLYIMLEEANYVSNVEAEDFYRDYVGELSHPKDSLSPSTLNFYGSVDALTDEYRWNHDQSIIDIYFDAECASDTKVVKSDGGFAVTIPKYEGTVYFCAD